VPDDDLDERLRAVERAVTDGDTPVRELSESAAVHDRLDDLEAEIADLAERVDALDATVQSLHGYVGELEHVNDRVQRRADAARAAVERLEDEQSRPDRSGTPTDDARAPGSSPAASERGGGDALEPAGGSDDGRGYADRAGDSLDDADRAEDALGDADRTGDGLADVDFDDRGRARRPRDGTSRGSTDDASLLDRVRESL
jgi:hypothetical protein